MPDIVAFDLNKTLIKENSWYDLNLAMGIAAHEDELLYRWGPEGEGILTYSEWIDILSRLMKARGKASRTNIEDVILKFNYLDGAKDVIKTLQNRGFVVGLITGALSLVAEKVADELAMNFVYCNAEMQFRSNNFLQDIHLKGEDQDMKVKAVDNLRQKYPDTKEIYYVADGDTDEEIFKVTKGIMVVANKVLHEDWKRRALEEGEKFSADRATSVAWKTVVTIQDVPKLI